MTTKRKYKSTFKRTLEMAKAKGLTIERNPKGYTLTDGAQSLTFNTVKHLYNYVVYKWIPLEHRKGKKTMTERDLDMLITEYREKRRELLKLAQQAGEAIAVIAVESKANDGEISEAQSNRHKKLEYIKNKILNNL